MAQTQRISKNNTTVRYNNGATEVTLHNTLIFHRLFNRVQLNTGGYATATTVARMNQCANELCDGAFHVSRAGGAMRVQFRNGDNLAFDGDTIEFTL